MKIKTELKPSQVNIDDVRRRDLVIAFWDADSNSHDDYMEGVKIIKYLLHLHHILIQIRFSLKDLVYFQKLDKIVKVELRHQHRDGHVSYDVRLYCIRN